MLRVEATFDASIVFVIRELVTLAFPEMSKLNAGVSVLIPIKPEPPAAYNEILSAVVATVGSFSIPIVRRPAFVVAPEKSWYLMYA